MDRTLAGPTGAKHTIYLGLAGATALYGSLTVTVESTNEDRVTVGSVTNEGAATVNGDTYASGDLHSVVVTAANNDMNVSVPIKWRVVGTGYDQRFCTVIERKACR